MADFADGETTKMKASESKPSVLRISNTTLPFLALVFAVASSACDPPSQSEPPKTAVADTTQVAGDAAPPEDTRPARVRFPPGGACTTPGRYVCDEDQKTALFCSAGVVQEIACRGLGGCSGGTKQSSCDDDLASLGDPCMNGLNGPTKNNYACGIDHRSALVCRDGHFALWRYCKAANGCQLLNDKIDCDNTLGDPGDPCGTTGSFVCNLEHSALLMCRDERLALVSTCRGPKGCYLLADRKNHCDDSEALMGDPCDTQGEVACSMDRKTELVCRDGAYVKKYDCKRKDGCEIRDGQLLCTP